MSSVYSVLIFEGHDLGGNSDVTLDPAYTWVVRDVDVFIPGPNADAGAQVEALAIGGIFVALVQTVVPPAGVGLQWTGRQVFIPPSSGPTLRVITGSTGGGVDVRISGYRLTRP